MYDENTYSKYIYFSDKKLIFIIIIITHRLAIYGYCPCTYKEFQIEERGGQQGPRPPGKTGGRT